MKVEMQSDSSGFGDFEEPNTYRTNPITDPRRRLWNNHKDSSDRYVSSSGFSTQRKESYLSDDDFEFVITRSTTAKKVKKVNLETHDNYRRFSESSESRHRLNGHFNTPRETPNRFTKEDVHRKNKHQPKGHPGLEKKIDFDPFGSSSEELDVSSDNSDVYDVSRYTSQVNETPFEPDDFPPPTPEPNNSRYSNAQMHRRRSSCTIIFTKIKTFFKTVGFRIRKCFSKSKTYFSRMIEKNKNKRRNKKSRQSLLNNQEYYNEVEHEQVTSPSTPKTNHVHRQKLEVPFNLNSSSDFEDVDTSKTKKKKHKFSGFRMRGLNKMKSVNSKNLKHVKLHSFPDE